MAILFDPQEQLAPSCEATIRKFERAARRLRIDVEIIGRDDFARLAEFDALFIRETTQLNHHTYRFSRRAAAEGLVVIDDPDSITKCTNKVYLAELLDRYGLATPRTLIVHRDNRDAVVREIGLPCILKQPDSSFSQGVTKVETPDALQAALDRLLEDSDLVIAQEFVPTAFDWRIGVLDRRPLFACKYHMASAHWQIAKTDAGGKTRYGRVEAVPLSEAPRSIITTAVRAANLIGDGLYGVDLKHVGGKSIVIEINDNPNIDVGQEDRVLGDTIYESIMQVFLARIQGRRNGTSRYRS
jgi:glutathione synthase/RimK-type ligase-like ATP-grasp enzyme